MDKASVARVCIMFNYKNIYSLKIFKIMSICCAFSFSLFIFPGLGLGWKEHLWRPRESSGHFLSWLLCPFWCWCVFVALGFMSWSPSSWSQGQGGCAQTLPRPRRAAVGIRVAAVPKWSVPSLIPCGHILHTASGFPSALSRPEEAFQSLFSFLLFLCCYLEPFKISVVALISPLLLLRASSRMFLL